MANKPLKSIKFPGLSDTYTVPQFDSASGGMGTAGKIPDSKAVGDAIEELKEDLNSEIAHTSDIIDSFPSEAFSSGPYVVNWEQGAISNIDGSDTGASSRIRCGYIPLGEEISASFESGASQEYWIRVYTSQSSDGFLGSVSFNNNGEVSYIATAPSSVSYAVNLDDILRIQTNAKYVRFVVKKSDNTNIIPSECKLSLTIKRGSFNGIDLDNVYVKKIKEPYSENELTFMYDIGNGYQTKGFLKLPSNYTQSGKAVPMVIFVHGSSDIFALSATSMTTYYQTQYNYIRDNGYAVFDCFGYGTKYSSGGCNTWGIPINNNCYLAGIEYVCNNYNIDKNNIFVSCKSLGGLQAFRMLMDSAFPIKAVGMLAPELWMLNMLFGYNYSDRQKIATELGFTEDTDDVMNFTNSTDPVPEGFYDYVTENLDKWCGIFTNYVGLPISDSNKPTYYSDAPETAGMVRNGTNRPCKIWIASDDNAVSYETAVAVISSLRNGGNYAQLRTMPANTGKHHAVDTDENALQTADVTTPLGIHYDSIATAYYELVEFFNQFIS